MKYDIRFWSNELGHIKYETDSNFRQKLFSARLNRKIRKFNIQVYFLQIFENGKLVYVKNKKRKENIHG